MDPMDDAPFENGKYPTIKPSPSTNTPLFLKRDGGLGEEKNFFSREKKFFSSPNSHTLYAKRSVER
jgi:hypothetical protein